jgi:hypothetical protein
MGSSAIPLPPQSPSAPTEVFTTFAGIIDQTAQRFFSEVSGATANKIQKIHFSIHRRHCFARPVAAMPGQGD